MTGLALAQIIIPLLPSIEGDISHLIAWISGVRTAAKQTGAWTAELDMKFRTCLLASGQDPNYSHDKNT
jgi:hypothetical protein